MTAPPGYSFIRHISEGGFGTVIEAEENSTGEHFAVKMIRSVSEKDKERIGREVHRLQTFAHPHIVRLKEVVAMENMQAIVMELGEHSLAQVVKSHSERGVLVDRHIVYQVMVDISSALYFMHNHPDGRTAHGDVKLENILLFGDGHAKLCDLGAAESEDVSSTRGVMSMQYVSPDRLEDAQGRASGSSDVWALGIVLHFLLFGKSPFRSEHAAGLIREIGSFRASQIGTSCGEDEREMLIRMLDPDCGSRLTSTQLVESSILRCLINTTWAGWKLSEMKMRETEKRVAELTKEKQTLQNQLKEEQTARQKYQDTLRTSEATIAELTTEKKTLQDEMKRMQKEMEEAEKERNELKRKLEYMEAMIRTTQPKGMDGKDGGRRGTEQWIVGPKAERTEERVVRSRNGQDAIEWYPDDGYIPSGSVFTRTEGTCPTLLSFSFGKVVARFTFTISRISRSPVIGIVASSKTNKVKKGTTFFTNLVGGAGWNVYERCRDACQNTKGYSSGSACAAGRDGQRVVLEADGRDGKRTLQLSQNGWTQPTFFSNIPVPFRFAILLSGMYDSVSIDSVEELPEPTLTGGTIEIRMDRWRCGMNSGAQNKDWLGLHLVSCVQSVEVARSDCDDQQRVMLLRVAERPKTGSLLETMQFVELLTSHLARPSSPSPAASAPSTASQLSPQMAAAEGSLCGQLARRPPMNTPTPLTQTEAPTPLR
ncbi:putative CBL-interacting protein kinase 17 [Blattamonas nauphoetae]|uniref:CBL-interacting protein kinase 17 n=1 Tax=Blattamonas nauphoetae TaxID=2049346 RepID=A0ABQ9X4E1_9EUKA|nr:putative CBL-interacting protein kinase 17 [Blattamonas nauphoetae]